MKHKAHVLNTAILVLVLAAAAAAQSTKIVQLRLDAEQGDAHAQNSLGFMYNNGQGVAPGPPGGRAVVPPRSGAGERPLPNTTLGSCTTPAKASPRTTSKPTRGGRATGCEAFRSGAGMTATSAQSSAWRGNGSHLVATTGK